MRAVTSPFASRPAHWAGRLITLWTEVWRYALVSVVALAVDYGTFALTLAVSPTRYLIGNVLGFITGVTAAYIGSVLWVFSEHRYRNRTVEFVLFAAAGLGGLAVGSAVLAAGVAWMKFDPRVAKILAVSASFVFNFGVRRMLLFASPTK
jgi:putative flippase GtrA